MISQSHIFANLLSYFLTFLGGLKTKIKQAQLRAAMETAARIIKFSTI